MVFPAQQYRWDIRTHGRQATLKRLADEPADPGAPFDGPALGNEDLSTELVMKFKPVSQRDVDGDRVLETDQIVQILGADITSGREPRAGDQIIDGADTLTIKAVTKRTIKTTVLRYDLRAGF